MLAGALAACSSRGFEPVHVVAADSADQVMDGMVTTITRNGMRVGDVHADTALIYQLRQVADLKVMTVVFFDSSGAVVSTVTAKTGVYHMRERSLDARGNVVVVTPSGRTLNTEHLIYDQGRNDIESDSAFRSTSPTGTLNGAAFHSDIAFKNVVVTHPTGHQKGPGIALPAKSGGTAP